MDLSWGAGERDEYDCGHGRDPCTSHLCAITLYHAHAHPLRTILIVRSSCPCLVPISLFSLPSCLAILEAYARVLVIPRPQLH